MKKFLVLLLLTASNLCMAQYQTSYIELGDSELASSMKEQIRYLSSAALEGRKAGSPGELEAAVYITECLKGYGVDVLSGEEGELFGIKQENGDTLRSRNVIGFIPGYDKTLRDHYIVISARLDNIGTRTLNVNGEQEESIFYGANGNASGLSMMMHLAKMLSTNRILLKRSIILAAYGASLEGNAGAWYFLNRSFADVESIDAMINLEMLGAGSRGFYAYTASNADLNAVVTAMSNTLQPVHPKIVSLEPVTSDHRMFYDKEIPAIMFTTGMYPEYNSPKDTESIIEYDGMERELEYIYNFTVKMACGSRPEFNPVAKAPEANQDADLVPYYNCDVKPSFLGSSDPRIFLQKWVYVYLRYPKVALEQGVQGRVVVDFVVDEKGKVIDVKVVRSSSPLLEEEALRVVKASPDWKPGRVRGKKVKSEISINIEFRLEKKK